MLIRLRPDSGKTATGNAVADVTVCAAKFEAQPPHTSAIIRIAELECLSQKSTGLNNGEFAQSLLEISDLIIVNSIVFLVSHSQ